MSPLFLYSDFMDLKDTVEAIVKENLKDDSHFLVDIIISSKQGPTKILILIDGDQGVNIDDCASISRSVGFYLEENNVIESKYTLEVSSPGVDHPLQNVRQYTKNIGREVKVTTLENEEFKGILKDIKEDKVLFDRQIKKGKKIELSEVEIPLENIKKTIVQISFK